MTTYAIIFLFGAVAILALRRLLFALLRWSVMIIGVALAGRLMLMADERLAQPGWLAGSIVGGVMAFVVIGLLSYAFIYHSLVAADRRRAIDKAYDDEKRRRLW